MKRNLMWLASFGLILLLTACGQSEPAKEKQAVTENAKPMAKEPACELTMGWDPWEPYMYLTPGNTVSGLDIEIIEAVATEAKCELKFVQNDWMNLLKQVQEGTVDLVAGASITEKRKSYALFSDSYREESFALYVRKGEADQFSGGIAGIISAGKRFGVTTDYLYGDEIAVYRDDPQYASQFISSAVGEANYYNLLSHNVDVIVEDPFVGAYNLKRKGIDDQIEKLPFALHTGEVHLMFSIKSVDFTVVERFNNAFKNIQKDGRYQAILKKYLL